MRLAEQSNITMASAAMNHITDLKRYGKLTSAYLSEKNPDIEYFDDTKHTVRPIPQTFLDAITNPDEFGSNGY